jgi:hypothetical protein
MAKGYTASSAEILSWSRFAGLALQGATLRGDEDVNQELYGTKLVSKDILPTDRKAPADGRASFGFGPDGSDNGRQVRAACAYPPLTGCLTFGVHFIKNLQHPAFLLTSSGPGASVKRKLRNFGLVNRGIGRGEARIGNRGCAGDACVERAGEPYHCEQNEGHQQRVFDHVLALLVSEEAADDRFHDSIM